MRKIFPENLKKGDLLCVIAPSKSFILAIPSGNRVIAEKRLGGELGLRIGYSSHLKERDALESSSIASRISDLHTAFADKKVKGVICAYGGTNSNTLLPYIDWSLIRRNPKPFIGYSDITALMNALYTKTGLVTYFGPTFSGFAMKRGFEYSLENFKRCLFYKEVYALTPSSKWSDDDWDTKQDKRVFLKNRGFIVLQQGKARGTSIGGSLCTLNLLQGTEYMPSLKGAIIFLEDPNIVGGLFARNFERDLESLLQQKDAQHIRGIVFGRFARSAKMSIKKLQFIISSKKLPKNIPIIANTDFGHTTPVFTFPIGGEVEIEAKGKKATMKVLKH